jgi:hypothetical protein
LKGIYKAFEDLLRYRIFPGLLRVRGLKKAFKMPSDGFLRFLFKGF